MNYLDLFSGIGGFALGAYWAGWRFEKHYFSEIDPWCCKLYQQRFPDAVPLGDITKINGGALVEDAEGYRVESGGVRIQRTRLERREGDQPNANWSGSSWILSGGFPCQDISTAGKGAGITGARSGLWFEYARLIGEIRPRYAIMENVGALTRRGLDRVLGSLAEIGYDAEWSDIRASDVGAPHRRERIWIVAYPAVKRCGTRGTESAGQQGKPCASDGREDVADADNTGLEGRREHRGDAGELPPWSSGEPFTGDWSFEPDVR
ncbi:MAG: DNA (cytosine-5-)-methyltransferase [Actinomycetia bacterium]|nr:DNA (cytosine-5-)-methyltransferase [Actinomycetes bacterium]